jgi:hypothetical protein
VKASGPPSGCTRGAVARRKSRRDEDQEGSDACGGLAFDIAPRAAKAL